MNIRTSKICKVDVAKHDRIVDAVTRHRLNNADA